MQAAPPGGRNTNHNGPTKRIPAPPPMTEAPMMAAEVDVCSAISSLAVVQLEARCCCCSCCCCWSRIIHASYSGFSKEKTTIKYNNPKWRNSSCSYCFIVGLQLIRLRRYLEHHFGHLIFHHVLLASSAATRARWYSSSPCPSASSSLSLSLYFFSFPWYAGHFGWFMLLGDDSSNWIPPWWHGQSTRPMLPPPRVVVKHMNDNNKKSKMNVFDPFDFSDSSQK
jgi:hypothetical protein